MTSTAPGNLFEWAWEHYATPGLAREILLRLAWDTQHDEYSPNPWPGYASIRANLTTDVDAETVADAIDTLIDQGVLVLTGDLAKAAPRLEYEIRVPFDPETSTES